MFAEKTRQVVLAARPDGQAKLSDFGLREMPIKMLSVGELFLRGRFFSLDPYMRGRMDDRESYATPLSVGEVMPGEAICIVEESLHSEFKPGDLVLAHNGRPIMESADLAAAMNERFVASLVANPKVGASGSADAWTRAFDERSTNAFAAAFAPSITLEASVLTRTVEGCRNVRAVMTAGSRLYEALNFTRRTGDGDHTYQEWEARLRGGERVVGVTILTTDEGGAITAITIHHRPLPAALRFSSELGHSLAETLGPGLFHSA